MKVISSLLGSFLLLLAFCFAITNRQSTVVYVWPLELEIEAPLYLLTLAPLFVGLIIGALVTWLGVLPHRLTTRRIHKELAQLHEKMNDLHHMVKPSSPPLVPSRPRPLTWCFWKKSS